MLHTYSLDPIVSAVFTVLLPYVCMLIVSNTKEAHKNLHRRSIDAINGQQLQGNQASNNTAYPPYGEIPLSKTAPTSGTGSAR